MLGKKGGVPHLQRHLEQMSDKGNWFQFRRDYFKSGLMSKTEAIFFQDLVNIGTMPGTYCDANGFFLCTREFLQKSLGFDEHVQKRLLKSMQKKGWIQLKMSGRPLCRWLFVDVEKVEIDLQKCEGKPKGTKKPPRGVQKSPHGAITVPRTGIITVPREGAITIPQRIQKEEEAQKNTVAAETAGNGVCGNPPQEMQQQTPKPAERPQRLPWDKLDNESKANYVHKGFRRFLERIGGTLPPEADPVSHGIVKDHLGPFEGFWTNPIRGPQVFQWFKSHMDELRPEEIEDFKQITNHNEMWRSLSDLRWIMEDSLKKNPSPVPPLAADYPVNITPLPSNAVQVKEDSPPAAVQNSSKPKSRPDNHAAFLPEENDDSETADNASQAKQLADKLYRHLVSINAITTNKGLTAWPRHFQNAAQFRTLEQMGELLDWYCKWGTKVDYCPEPRCARSFIDKIPQLEKRRKRFQIERGEIEEEVLQHSDMEW